MDPQRHQLEKTLTDLRSSGAGDHSRHVRFFAREVRTLARCCRQPRISARTAGRSDVGRRGADPDLADSTLSPWFAAEQSAVQFCRGYAACPRGIASGGKTRLVDRISSQEGQTEAGPFGNCTGRYSIDASRRSSGRNTRTVDPCAIRACRRIISLTVVLDESSPAILPRRSLAPSVIADVAGGASSAVPATSRQSCERSAARSRSIA